jgi:predicted amidophosphoribosyltransferase
MHEGRLRERGYNQAVLLAAPLAQAAGIPFHDKVLQRVRETRTQVGLNARERQDNVADAFLADSSLAKGQHIVIVDDVRQRAAGCRSSQSLGANRRQSRTQQRYHRHHLSTLLD